MLKLAVDNEFSQANLVKAWFRYEAHLNVNVRVKR